ncbi:MAG: hypothetical protein IJZ93_03400 [Clostridia bacterium]|nr:hypothetical protein [Clostridia bacterium]
MKNNFKKVSIIIACILIFNLFSCSKMFSDEIYIFSDISECANLEINKASDVTVQEYTSTDSDKKLNELKYDAFYAAKYESSEIEFEIYAYEFESSETAKKYFENVTGRKSELDSNFLASGGMNSFEFIVIDHQNAYVVYGHSGEQQKVYSILADAFSKKLEF